eukprot:gene4500-4737_t
MASMWVCRSQANPPCRADALTEEGMSQAEARAPTTPSKPPHCSPLPGMPSAPPSGLDRARAHRLFANVNMFLVDGTVVVGFGFVGTYLSKGPGSRRYGRAPGPGGTSCGLGCPSPMQQLWGNAAQAIAVCLPPGHLHPQMFPTAFLAVTMLACILASSLTAPLWGFLADSTNAHGYGSARTHPSLPRPPLPTPLSAYADSLMHAPPTPRTPSTLGLATCLLMASGASVYFTDSHALVILGMVYTSVVFSPVFPFVNRISLTSLTSVSAGAPVPPPPAHPCPADGPRQPSTCSAQAAPWNSAHAHGRCPGPLHPCHHQSPPARPGSSRIELAGIRFWGAAGAAAACAVVGTGTYIMPK